MMTDLPQVALAARRSALRFWAACVTTVLCSLSTAQMPAVTGDPWLDGDSGLADLGPLSSAPAPRAPDPSGTPYLSAAQVPPTAITSPTPQSNTYYTGYEAPAPPSSRSLFLAAFMPAIGQGVAQVGFKLLDKLVDSLFSKKPEVQAAQFMQANPWAQGLPTTGPLPQPTGYLPTVYAPTAQLQAAASRALNGLDGRQWAPGITASIIQIDPRDGRPIRALPTQGGTLYTNDRFYLEFMSNTPGILMLSNVAASGRVNDLGSYPIPAGVTRRIPDVHDIGATGQTGTEILTATFMPCDIGVSTVPLTFAEAGGRTMTFARDLALMPRADGRDNASVAGPGSTLEELTPLDNITAASVKRIGGDPVRGMARPEVLASMPACGSSKLAPMEARTESINGMMVVTASAQGARDLSLLARADGLTGNSVAVPRPAGSIVPVGNNRSQPALSFNLTFQHLPR